MAKKESEKEVKKITTGLVFSWIFSVLFSLSALGSLVNLEFLGALFYLIASAVLFPPLNKFFKEKYSFKLSGGLKFLIVIVCLILASVVILSGESLDYPINSLNSSTDDVDSTVSSEQTYVINGVDYTNYPQVDCDLVSSFFSKGDSVMSCKEGPNPACLCSNKAAPWELVFLEFSLLPNGSLEKMTGFVDCDDGQVYSFGDIVLCADSVEAIENKDLFDSNFAQFYSDFTPKTDLQKEELWKSYKGGIVKWTFYVDSVDKDVFGNYVVLGSISQPDEYDFTNDISVTFKDSEKNALLTFNEGDLMTIKAELVDYEGIFGDLFSVKDAVVLDTEDMQYADSGVGSEICVETESACSRGDVDSCLMIYNLEDAGFC